MTKQKPQPSHAFIRWGIRPLLWFTAIYSGANAVELWNSSPQMPVIVDAASDVER